MSEPIYQPLERRPIQSRNTRWAARVTHWLVARRVTPNAISLFGMFAAIAGGATFAATSHTAGISQRLCWLIGGLLCQVRLLCNLFDGMVAVERQIASRKGELYNEVPDRVSDAAIFIGLGYAAGSDVALGFGAALVAVFVAYVRAVGKATGAPNDFCGPMAKQQRMAMVTALSAYLTVSPASWRLAWGEVRIALVIVIAGGLCTAARRLRRAARHLEGNRP